MIEILMKLLRHSPNYETKLRNQSKSCPMDASENLSPGINVSRCKGHPIHCQSGVGEPLMSGTCHLTYFTSSDNFLACFCDLSENGASVHTNSEE